MSTKDGRYEIVKKIAMSDKGTVVSTHKYLRDAKTEARRLRKEEFGSYVIQAIPKVLWCSWKDK